MRISKYIFSFDYGFSNFLSLTLLNLSQKISDEFKRHVSKNSQFVSNVVEQMLKNFVFELLPFKIYCHVFFCRCGSKTAADVNFAQDFLLMRLTQGGKLIIVFLSVLAVYRAIRLRN